ncbi:ROK family transcriptional regulator [Saccharopolyspora elongata]|uniref:ROK family transcriptional regulator n=1 Tax=Saccharopolyspora elongata TaxID=2530387 RepID=A0A4R4Z563_9PSEU|nr:ROK family transcriptional regulator [Saccharopolyspora elongata]
MLGAIRQAGPLSRAAIEHRIALSTPTVSRQVTTLIDLGVVREVPELTRFGAVGRPRVPVDIDETVLAACGVHVGVSTTTIGLADLRGRLLAGETIPTPVGVPEDVLDFLADRIRAFLRRRPERGVVVRPGAGRPAVGRGPTRLRLRRSSWQRSPCWRSTG